MKATRTRIRIVAFVMACVLLPAYSALAESGPAPATALPAESVGPGTVGRLTPSIAMFPGPPSAETNGELAPTVASWIGRDLLGKDPHIFAPLPEELGIKFPIPEGIDPSRIPGWDGPANSGPDDEADRPWYILRDSASNTWCRPQHWDHFTQLKMLQWGYDQPAPHTDEGMEMCRSDENTFWPDTRYGGEFDEKGGGKGGKGGGADNGGNDNGGPDDGGGGGNDNGGTDDTGNDNAEQVDNQNESQPSPEKDSEPEGDDPDEFLSPVSSEIADALGAGVAEGIDELGRSFADSSADGDGSDRGGGADEGGRERHDFQIHQGGKVGSTGGGVDPEDGRPDEFESPAFSFAVNSEPAGNDVNTDSSGQAASPPIGEPGAPQPPPRPNTGESPAVASVVAADGAARASSGYAACPPIDEPGTPPKPPRPNTDETPAATVMTVRGAARRLALADGRASWTPLQAGDALAQFDVVRTGFGSGLELRLVGGGQMTVGSATKLGLGNPGVEADAPAQVMLKYGSLRLALPATAAAIQVETPAGPTRLTRGKGAVTFDRVSGLQLQGGMRRLTTADLSEADLGPLHGADEARIAQHQVAPSTAGAAPTAVVQTPADRVNALRTTPVNP